MPLLLATLMLLVLALPCLLATARAGAAEQQAELAAHWADGELAGAAVRVVAILAIAIPVVGIGCLLLRLVRQVAGGVWKQTEGKPGRRTVAGVAVAAVVAGLAFVWWPTPDTYRPVQSYERGTLADAVPFLVPQAGVPDGWRTAPPVAPSPSGRRTGSSPPATTPTSRWCSCRGSSPPPTPRRLSGRAAMRPRRGCSRSTCRPLRRGTTPRRSRVNTEDGTVLYDVAFALVWADGGTVDTTDEAYAFASCDGCAAVAVGFQVVLVVGQADVVVPRNLAAAANYTCIDCLTYALASQLVIALDGPLSEEGRARTDELWQEVDAFAENIRDVPLDGLQARLTAYRAQIAEIVQTDPSAGTVEEDTDTDLTGGPSDPDATSGPGEDAGAEGATMGRAATAAPPPTRTRRPFPAAAPSRHPRRRPARLGIRHRSSHRSRRRPRPARRPPRRDGPLPPRRRDRPSPLAPGRGSAVA